MVGEGRGEGRRWGDGGCVVREGRGEDRGEGRRWGDGGCVVREGRKWVMVDVWWEKVGEKVGDGVMVDVW